MMMMNSWSLVVLGLLHGGLGRPPIEKGTTPGGLSASGAVLRIHQIFVRIRIRGSIDL